MALIQRSKSSYRYFLPISTRWMDNDVYGHVNNVVFYSWFDTIVNQFLIEHHALDVLQSESIGLVIETQCNYFSPVSFPEKICAALRVVHLGNSSVRYEIGIFAGEQEIPSAQGHFVHVYVDRQERKPMPIPATIRALLQKLYCNGAA